MLTAAQRPKFFKLARAAWSTVSPGVPFDEWRKAQMEWVFVSPKSKRTIGELK